MLKIKHLRVRVLGSAIILLCAICPVFGAAWKALPGNVPQVVSRLPVKRLLSATNQMRLAIGLPLRDATGLNKFLSQVYDPASPNFRHFLTPNEFTARFGPTEQEYEAVKNFARTNGLAVSRTYANRLVLDVTGPAVAVEKAFHVTLRVYRHPTEARNFFAPDTEPVVNAALPVADVQGLSDYWRPHPMLRRLTAMKTMNATPRSGSAPDGAGGYFGNDFRNAYAPGVTLTGAGQMVGLVEFDGFYSNDIAAYANAAGNGRTNIAIQTVLLDGVSGAPGYSGISGADSEVSLDIEMAMAMAPGLAKIVVFEGNTPNDILNSMLGFSNTVGNLSCSWGWSGGPTVTTDNIFKGMEAVGQSFFNASGDSDAYTTSANSADNVDNPSSYNAPASNPYITQVGGTTLTMNGTGASYGSETVWNWGAEYGASYNGVGSSGGISSHYPIPSWQTNVSDLAGAGGSTRYRNIPDVALTADKIYVISGGNGVGSSGWAGTSCAAPLWAGFMAMVNQQAAANGRPPVGFINPALYAIAAGPDYASCFHDVTTGNNTWSKSKSLFYAGSGYDLCTGLGTPHGQNLINALAGFEALIVSPLTGAATGVAGGSFSITSGNFLLTNAGNSSLTWSLVNTSAWLQVSATSGTLAAAARTNLTCSLTAAASNLAVGTYTANLTFSNWTAQTAQNAVFTLQVNPPPLVVSPTNGFVASGPVGGGFSVTSQDYLLANQSGSSLPWGVINTSSWLSASPSGGILVGGAQTNMTISLTAAADTLTPGIYTANVLVTNSTGPAISLPFTINVGQSILENGGFETGDFSFWTLSGASNNYIVTSSNSFVHSGNYGAALGQSDSLGYLSQTLMTLPGQNYLLSLWLDNPTNANGATPNQFLVQWNGATFLNETNLPYTAWTNLHFIVTATGASTVLQFGFQDTPSYLGFDDVSLMPLSAPVFKATQPTTTDFNLTWDTVAGLVYQVQYTTNLLQTNWIDLGQPLTATNSSLTISDSNVLSSSPQRFYRLIELP